MKILTKVSKIKVNFILIFILSVPVFIWLLSINSFSPTIQFRIVLIATILYLISAILHHYRDKTLTWELTIEYVLIALLALIVTGGLFI